MHAAAITRVEANIDRMASALFALACGYAAYTWLAVTVVQPLLIAESGGAAALAYFCCTRALSSVKGERRPIPVPVFDLRDYEPGEEPQLLLAAPDEEPAASQAEPLLLTHVLTELLLTEPYEALAEIDDEPLLLDDVLTELAPDSRVVKLFDPASMPTPNELRARIDRHLSRGPTEQPADATQALHQALAELRRSIR